VRCLRGTRSWCSTLSLILAIDQGTSSTKACVYEAPGLLLGQAAVPVGRRSLPGGAVEQDPVELVESCRASARLALSDAGLEASDLDGAALANQGESFLLFSPSGTAYGPVVGWQDTRCGTILEELEAEGAGAFVGDLTGLPLHALFSAPKLAHRLRSGHVPGDALFGTLDTWLVHQLDPRRPHVTDRATASRTMLAALGETDWDDGLLALFGVEREMLPEIVECDARVASLELDGHEVPLLASGYDMGLAVLGHGCLDAGETKATFGTCLGAMAASGAVPSRAPGLLTTVAYSLDGSCAFAFDGEVASAGSLVAWAIRLGIAGSLEELDELARSAPDSGGAVLVPAISGLGAPHWREDVQARLVGITDAFGRPEFARAVFDAIAWSLADVIDAFRAAGLPVKELRVDGGLTASGMLLRRCADCLQVPLVLSPHVQSTSFGAAALAMLASGAVEPEQIRASARGPEVIEPALPPRREEREIWREALQDTLEQERSAVR
jgi:glycerol kinase